MQYAPPPDVPGATAPLRARHGIRWKRWAILLVVLLALRVALRVVLGPLIEERLSRVLGADVEVGDVSFAPLDAIVTLRDVVVRTPGPAAREGDAAPIIAARRVTIDVQWLPLLHHELLVRELALEDAHVDLDRFAPPSDGLTRLLHVEPASELPPGWTFALDRIVLRDAKLELPALGDAGAGPSEIGVRDAEVSTLRRRASAFGRAPNLRIDALIDGGRVRVDGTSDLRDDGIVVDALLRVKDIPVAPLQRYLAGLGWSDVGGRVSGQLHYQRDPGRRDLLSGRLEARRIAIRVPDFDPPAFAVRRAVAELDAIDLAQRRVALASLTLHGARLAVRPDLAAPLPVLDGIAFAERDVKKHPRRAATPPPSAPWSWAIARLATPFARLEVAGSDVLLPISVSGESLGPGAYWSPLRAWIGRGDGSAVFDGTLRLTHGLSIDGRLTAVDVDAPLFARALGLPLAELAQAGRASGDLTIEIEPAATKVPPLDVRGKLKVAGPWLAGPAPEDFALGAAAIDLTLAGIDLGRTERGARAPTVVRISDVTVSAPYAVLTRTPEGWAWPPFAPEAAAAATSAADGTVPDADTSTSADRVANTPAAFVDSPAAAAASAPATPDAAATDGASDVPATETVVAAVRATPGRLLIVDRTLEPAITFDMALVEAWAQGVHLPTAAVGSFVAQARDARLGAIQLGGSGNAWRHEIELSAESVPLAAATPYLVQAGLPYRFTGGSGAVLTRIALTGQRWSADSTLTLHDARLVDDGVTLRQSLGMPPDAALAALRDADGDVTLRLPLSSAAEDPRALTDVVAGAVRDAVLRARQTPLPEAPIQIAFVPGSAELSPQASRQLATIADVLAARHDVLVELHGVLSNDDRRWIAEQELVGDLEEPGGLMGVLRTLGVRDRSVRIREALQERAQGRPGRLDEDDEAAVDELIAQGPPVPDDRLAALASARLTRIASTLATYAVAPARVVLSDPSGHASATPPAVRARITVDTRATTLTRLEAER
jgi:hypothetical protein